MLSTDAILVATVLTWLGFAYKLRHLRRNPRAPALRALCCAFLALALALTLLHPAVYEAVNQIAGRPHLARLLAHVCGLLNQGALQVMLLYLLYRPDEAARRARTRYAALAVVLTATVALFVAAPIRSGGFEFTAVYARMPLVAAYLLVFLGYLAYCLYDIGRLSLRYSRQALSRSLRVGLQLIAAGSVVGVLYTVDKAAYVGLRLLGVRVPDFESVLSPVLITISVVLVVVGLTVPAWGPQLGSAVTALRNHALYRALHPLWRDVTAVAPAIPVPPPPLAHLDERLYRRVIEVRDGLLALRPYHDTAAAQSARELAWQVGLAGRDLDAVVDAAAVTAALRAKRERRRTGNQLPIVDAPPVDDLTVEAAWLARVSRAYARPPLVARSGARGAGDRAARLLTEVFAPWVLVIAVLLAVGLHSAGNPADGLRWGLLAAAFAGVIPFAFIVARVIAGRLTDHHVGLREQRFLPLTVCIGSLLTGLALLGAAGASREMVAVVAAMGAGLATAIVITLRYKISVHALTAAGAAVILAVVFGPVLLLTVPVAAAVCWARVRLGDHTTAQVASGAVAGVLAGLLFALLR